MGFLRSLFGSKKPATAPGTTAKPPIDVYLGLRQIALGAGKKADQATPSDIPLTLLMEWVQSNVNVTLAGFADGTTSLYFGNGGGILGSGSRPPVSDATKAWLKLAQDEFASAMVAVTDCPVAAPDQVRFYLVYTDRILAGEAAEASLKSGQHSLARLYREAHKVISQVRMHAPK